MNISTYLKWGRILLKSLFRIGKSKIGLSLILVDELELENGCKIGHFNIIIIKKLVMKKNARIGNFNLIKGDLNLFMEEKTDINLQNKISNRMNNGLKRPRSTLHLKYHAKIGVAHLLDLTDNIIIGENSMLAGVGSQIWTHSFYFSKVGEKVTRIDGPVTIGRNCYIATRCVVCAGSSIPDATTIGACSCISKSLKEQGLYVNQPLRFIDFDPDEVVEKMNMPKEYLGNVEVFRKEK